MQPTYTAEAEELPRRRCRRFSPRSSRPTGTGSGRLEGDDVHTFVTEWRKTLLRGRLPRARLAGRVRRRRAVGARAGDHRRGVRPGRRADRRTERRVRHPDARQHAAAVRHRRAEGALPPAHPLRRRHVVPGLQRAQRRIRPRQHRPCGPCSTATSGCSTVRRSGRRPGTSPTTSSRSPAPTPRPPSTRASRSCWSTCVSRGSRCVRSR